MRKGTGAIIVGTVVWIGGIIFSVAMTAMVEGMNPDWEMQTTPSSYIGAQVTILTMFLSYLPFAIVGACFVLPGTIVWMRD